MHGSLSRHKMQCLYSKHQDLKMDKEPDAERNRYGSSELSLSYSLTGRLVTA